MAERFEVEELDDDTLAYLQKAARREGGSMPGVFFDWKEEKPWGGTLHIWVAVFGLIILLLAFLIFFFLDDKEEKLRGWPLHIWAAVYGLSILLLGFLLSFFDANVAKLWGRMLPIWAAVCGPIILALTFQFSWGSTSDPPATAMFLTAGIMLGGWLIVAAVRAMIARRRANYLGDFTYIDPLYIWNAIGTGVWVTPIDLLVGAACLHHSNESGYYKNSTVEITLADKSLTLTFNAEQKSEYLAHYLQALSEIKSPDPAERGYTALEEIEYEAEYEDDDRSRVTAIPRPEKVRSSLGWLPLVLLPVVGLLVFYVSLMLAKAGRDDAVFAMVKDKQAPDLRYYLIDKRNSRHVEEAKTRLRTILEPMAQKAAGQGNKVLGAGLADIVRAVAGEARPLITLRFPKQEKRPDTAAGYLSPAVTETMNREMIKEITDRLSQHLGQQTADYAEVAEAPAMIEFVPKVTVPGRAGDEVRLDWVVTLQASPEAKPVAVTISSAMQQVGDDPAPAVRALYRQLNTAFLGQLTQQK